MENNEIFDQYLRGELSPTEMTTFEYQLANDPILKSEFERHQKAISAIEFASIRDKISRIGLQAQKEKNIPIKTWMGMAAALVFLVVGYWVVFSKHETVVSGDQIFATIHFKDPGLPTLMGDTRPSGYMDDFMIAYKQNKYGEALTLAEKLLKQYPNNDTIQFYRAMCFFEKGTLDRASKDLQQLKNNSTEIGQKASWYLYMIDLKNGDLVSAKAGIQAIANQDNHIFRLEAIDALDVLNMVK
jgi:tetratricopeptide (TPR) repeat protein